jgi:hypothetical protein
MYARNRQTQVWPRGAAGGAGRGRGSSHSSPPRQAATAPRDSRPARPPAVIAMRPPPPRKPVSAAVAFGHGGVLRPLHARRRPAVCAAAGPGGENLTPAPEVRTPRRSPAGEVPIRVRQEMLEVFFVPEESKFQPQLASVWGRRAPTLPAPPASPSDDAPSDVGVLTPGSAPISPAQSWAGRISVSSSASCSSPSGARSASSCPRSTCRRTASA